MSIFSVSDLDYDVWNQFFYFQFLLSSTVFVGMETNNLNNLIRILFLCLLHVFFLNFYLYFCCFWIFLHDVLHDVCSWLFFLFCRHVFLHHQLSPNIFFPHLLWWCKAIQLQRVETCNNNVLLIITKYYIWIIIT